MVTQSLTEPVPHMWRRGWEYSHKGSLGSLALQTSTSHPTAVGLT